MLNLKKPSFYLLPASSVRATWNTVLGSSLLYVITNKKGFAAKRNPLSISLTACAQIAPMAENSLQFHGFVKQNLGDNSVAVNALWKDLQLNYLQSRGRTVLMVVQVLLLRYWDDLTLNTWRYQIPLSKATLEYMLD